MFEHRLIQGTQMFISDSPVNGDEKMQRRTVDELLSDYPKYASDYFDRALRNLSLLVNHPAATLPLGRHEFSALFTEAQNVGAMLSELADMGYIKTGENFSYRIAAEGWARLRDIERPGKNSKQAFIAMSFEKEHLAKYEKFFRSAIEADGKTKAVIVNRVEHNGKIDDLIISEIRKSRYLVADFTGHRGGVYFEAGFAMGLGIPVVWCLEEGQPSPHFDTRQYNHIFYDSPQDLLTKLNLRISALAL